MFVVSFYNSLTPLPLLTLIVFFTIGFWLDKFGMLYLNSSPNYVTKDMSKLMLRIMEVDIVIFTLGNLVTMILVNAKQPPILVHHSGLYHILPLGFIKIALIAFLIAVIYKLTVELVEKMSNIGYRSKEKTYSDVMNSFRHYYWSSNPATKLGEERQFEFSRA